MMADRPVVTRTCWELGKLPLDGLKEWDVDRLRTAAGHAARQLKTGNLFTRTRDGTVDIDDGEDGTQAVLAKRDGRLYARQVVGVLSVPGLTVEILPKIDGGYDAARRSLIHMIAVAFDIRIAVGELADLATQRYDLLELLARMFADRLLVAVRRGLPRRYVGHEDDLPVLRGRLNVTRLVTHLAVRPDRLACRYDELSEDTPLNRVLKAAVSRLAGLVRFPENKRSLVELAARLERVGHSPRPLDEPVRLDRTNAAFHDLHRMACLFLADDWQSTMMGKEPGFALLFPMNQLFERFVGRCLERTLAPPRVVHLQPSAPALVGTCGSTHITVRPDAVSKAPNETIVFDTKWKEPKPHRGHFRPAQADAYQMLAYARAYNATRLILLYPRPMKTAGSHRNLHRWTVANSDCDCALDAATVDVSKPHEVETALLEIVDSPGAAERPA